MLVLLPPSESKAPSGSGDPLEVDTLSLPDLNPARERVLESLEALCAQPDDAQACAVLGLSPGQRGEVARNSRLRQAPAMPAGHVYTGVLYDALDLPSLGAAAYAIAERSVLVFSGLWGALRLNDRIPPYRCPVGVRLPGLGGLGPHWRRAMPTPIATAAGDGLVLDLRSAAYAAMWTPDGDLARRTAAVRVLHERIVDGVAKRSVVSHFNKSTKGRLLRDLMQAGAQPRTPAELVTALRDLKHTVDHHTPQSGKPCRLDVVVTEL